MCQRLSQTTRPRTCTHASSDRTVGGGGGHAGRRRTEDGARTQTSLTTGRKLSRAAAAIFSPIPCSWFPFSSAQVECKTYVCGWWGRQPRDVNMRTMKKSNKPWKHTERNLSTRIEMWFYTRKGLRRLILPIGFPPCSLQESAQSLGILPVSKGISSTRWLTYDKVDRSWARELSIRADCMGEWGSKLSRVHESGLLGLKVKMKWRGGRRKWIGTNRFTYASKYIHIGNWLK